ncbi:MAG: hypothetical protein G8345_10405 [Magnetococcales bacterium]|nr:hypothetical protein [Magnetococcales bacterium]NGZ27283.1 hypothetical protein [Magnetococcales bacterium]
MNLFTLLILIGVGYGVYKLFLAPSRKERLSATSVAHPLARCDGCGVWVPEQQVMQVEGKVFCSTTCRDKDG